MNKESFLETLRLQYAEEINEALLECEHRGGAVDFTKLNKLLNTLMKNAKVDGFPPREFEELVKSAFPDFWSKIQLSLPLKKAS